MKKNLFLLILLPAFFFLTNAEKVLAENTCTAAAGCVSKCKTPAQGKGSCDGGLICCEVPETSTTTTPGSGIQVPTGTGLPSGNIESVLAKTLDWIEGIFLTLSLIAFAIVGIMFLFSLGNANSGAHTNAKAYFNQAITALFIVGGSYILIKTINYLLQG